MEVPMSRIAWIAVGVITATLLTIVVNLATSGGAWWLWPVLVVLVITAIVVEVRRDRRSRPPAGPSQEISASGGARVEGSAQLMEAPGGAVSQKITARRKARVQRSSQTYRRR